MIETTGARSAAAVIHEYAKRHPGATAVIAVDDVESDDGDITWTYGRLDAEARRIGAWLGRHHAIGDRVLLLYPTGTDFVAAYVACLYVGVVAVPAPMPSGGRHAKARLQVILDNADVAAVLTTVGELSEIREWTALPVTATDDPSVTGGPPADDDWTPVAEVGPDTLAMLQYTSGTTGDPKGVRVLHRNLLHNASLQHRELGITPGDRVGGWIPHYHDMGLLGHLVPPLLSGATAVLMRSSTFLKRPHHWLRMIDKFELRVSAAPNFAYELCADKISDEQVAGLDLSCWRLAITGAEPLDPAVLDRFAKRFAHVGLSADALTPCYGMAEATLFVSGATERMRVTTVDPVALRRNRFVPLGTAGGGMAGSGMADGGMAGSGVAGAGMAGSGVADGGMAGSGVADGGVIGSGVVSSAVAGAEVVGSAVAGVEVVGCGAPDEYDVRIAHVDTGEPLPPGSIGELWLRGPSVGDGYWNDERPFGTNGYLRTGDLGTLHEGRLYVTGRVDEVVTVRGGVYYAQDIERELRACHPELTGAGAVFTAGEILVVMHEIAGRPAVEVLRALAAGIRRTVESGFGLAVGEVRLLRRGEVRRTTSGKIQRVAMRRLFLADELNAVHADRCR